MLINVHDREENKHKKHVEQGRKGAHFCPCWDFMAIHEGMPEFEFCFCDLTHLEDNAND